LIELDGFELLISHSQIIFTGLSFKGMG